MQQTAKQARSSNGGQGQKRRNQTQPNKRNTWEQNSTIYQTSSQPHDSSTSIWESIKTAKYQSIPLQRSSLNERRLPIYWRSARAATISHCAPFRTFRISQILLAMQYNKAQCLGISVNAIIGKALWKIIWTLKTRNASLAKGKNTQHLQQQQQF